ncbi:transcriptional regulator [Pseudomonas aeruginosa]
MDLASYVGALPRGGKKQLAASLGIPPSYLSRLISGDRAITAERALQIESATQGAVTRQVMRPDLPWSVPKASTPSPDLEPILPPDSHLVQCADAAVQASSAEVAP